MISSKGSTFLPAQDWAVTRPRLEEPARKRVFLRSCLARRLPDPGPGHNPWTGPSRGKGAEDGRVCWGQAPEQRCSAWPRAKLGAMSFTARTKHNTLPGRLLTTLRSLTVIHIQPPGSGVGTSEAHLLRTSARSMVWPHEPRRHGVRLACVVLLWTLRRPGGVSLHPASWIGTAVGLMSVGRKHARQTRQIGVTRSASNRLPRLAGPTTTAGSTAATTAWRRSTVQVSHAVRSSASVEGTSSRMPARGRSDRARVVASIRASTTRRAARNSAREMSRSA
jgi:hypothetical protein